MAKNVAKQTLVLVPEEYDVVEFEQYGEDRANYGEQLLSRLSGDLKRRRIPGCSREMLGRMRFFYRIYPQASEAVPSLFAKGLNGLRVSASRTAIWSPAVTKSKTALPLVVLPKANEIEHLIERDRALWEQRGGTHGSRLRDSPVPP